MKSQDSLIELSSGEYLDLLNPDPSVITPAVLAHHLSQANRFAGATSRPVSVVEHTLLVSKKLGADGESPLTILMGLHHDDPEAFIHDITRPLKDQIRELYGPIERLFENVIGEAMGFEITGNQAVKDADEWALSCEAYYLMPSGGIGWWSEGLYDPIDSAQRAVAQWLIGNSNSYVKPSYLGAMWLRAHHANMEASAF